MRIAVIGLGGIGSTFAFHLARAGHEVTAVARGQRLEHLRQHQAIILTSGQRAPVQVADALDTGVAWDLVLVTVLAYQVDDLLPTLSASQAKTVLFMFSTFASLDHLRNAVGPARFACGFPVISARVEKGRLAAQVYTLGRPTRVSRERWASVFTEAGIPSSVHADMQSWLRTHAAAVVPVMLLCATAYRRQAGISWSEAVTFAHALEEGLQLVRRLGNAITPVPMAFLYLLPTPVVTAVFWGLSRVPAMRSIGVLGTREPRALLDARLAVAPGPLPTLRSIRPPQ
jgi:2-dehydropantoate 2-reductase